MAQNESSSGAKCVRCQQPLPDGTTFCIGCGHQNSPDDMLSRQLGIDSELERRRGSLSVWNRIISFFTGWWHR